MAAKRMNMAITEKLVSYEIYIFYIEMRLLIKLGKLKKNNSGTSMW